jgi:hypothetical protein
VLQDEDAPAERGLLREVLEEADEICDSRDLDADVHGALSRLSSHGMPKIEGLTALLADFGIIAKARPTCVKGACRHAAGRVGGKLPGGGVPSSARREADGRRPHSGGSELPRGRAGDARR